VAGVLAQDSWLAEDRAVVGRLSRALLVVLLSIALAAPLFATAQPAGRMPRIGFISTASPPGSSAIEAFRSAMHDLGYVENRNIAIEWRWGHGTTERFSEFAAELVRLNVDAIVAANTPAGHAAQAATKTIPIVIATMVDPVEDGFVKSFPRPGGNITGLTLRAPELSQQTSSALQGSGAEHHTHRSARGVRSDPAVGDE